MAYISRIVLDLLTLRCDKVQVGFLSQITMYLTFSCGTSRVSLQQDSIMHVGLTHKRDLGFDIITPNVILNFHEVRRWHIFCSSNFRMLYVLNLFFLWQFFMHIILLVSNQSLEVLDGFHACLPIYRPLFHRPQ